jgi:hypothetical protein
MSYIKKQFFLKFYIFIILFSAICSQLTIIGPPLLSSKFINNTIEMEYGKVGLLTDFYIRGQIILETSTSTRDACNSFPSINLRKNNTNIYDENYKIILAYTGSCSISQKARNAQNAGASMLILIHKNNYFSDNFIYSDMGNDIYIPISFIGNSEGKILEEYILNNPNDKILVEINFKPKHKGIVDFKFFFSSSEPKAYELIGNMTNYINKFGEQVIFTPYYVVHKNPYYVEENPTSNLNCVSRGVYCYYPKATTITHEGQKILMEDIRQKCMFKITKEKNKDIKEYFKYLSTFAKLCINEKKISLTRECSKLTLKELGYSEDYLDECFADSFDVRPINLNSNFYIENNNKVLEKEYNEILKYKLTSFPAIIINDKLIPGIIKELNIVIQICNEVKEKPSFCSFITGFTDEHRTQSKRRSNIIYFLMFLLIVVNIGLFMMCRAYVLEKLKDRIDSDNIDVEGRIKNIINNYFVLRNNNNDYHSFENQSSNNKISSSNIVMNEGKVDTI